MRQRFRLPTLRCLEALLLFCLSIPTSAVAQWEIVVDTRDRQLKAVHFFDDQFGVAVGGGVSIATEDGGLTWSSLDTLHTSAYEGVVIDSTIVGPVVIAVGANLSVVRSVDRGVTWKSVNTGSNAPLYGVCYLGENKFAAFGAGGWFAESTDTGLTWQTRLIFPAAEMHASACLPSGTIWVGGYASNGSASQCCGVLLKSEDSGASWTKILELPDARSSRFYALEFVGEQTGFAISTGGFPRRLSRLWKTTDGGASWEDKGAYSEVNAIDFIDENVGVMVGQEGYIVWTEDGGETWVQHPSPSPLHLYDVTLLDTQTAVAVGDAFILRNGTGASVSVASDELPAERLSHWAYPNPATNTVTISFENGSPEAGLVHVTDVLGRVVNAPRVVTSTGSSQSIQLQLGTLPGGVYFYAIDAGARSASGSFLVVR